MSIGSVIKEYRLSHNMTMQEMADKSGLSKGYISMLEKGVHPQNGKEIIPSIETVQRLAKVMGITVDELLESVEGRQLVELSYIETARAAAEKNRFKMLFNLFGSLDEEDQKVLIKQAQFFLNKKENDGDED